MKIAVCDDDRTTREQIASLIRKQEPTAEVITFESGEDMISSKENFSVSLLDVEMKKMSGIDVAKHIRKQEKIGREKSIGICKNKTGEVVKLQTIILTTHYLRSIIEPIYSSKSERR